MKKKIKCIAAAGLAAWLAVSPCVAASAAEDETGGDGIITALHDSDKQYHNLESMTKYWDYNIAKESVSPDRDHNTQDTDSLPSKYDLRNVDGKCYVSPVKLQDPWPTCWSFGAVAAAETSLASAFGFDYNDKNAENAEMFDLSERHLAWFMYNALPEGNKKYPSQAGEGNYPLQDTEGMDNQQKSTAVFSIGGYMAQATTLLSAGIGPVLEKDVPYEGHDAELFDKIYSFYSMKIDSNGKIEASSLTPLITNTPMNEQKYQETVSQFEAAGYTYVTYDEAMAISSSGNPEYADKTIFFSMAQSGNGDWTVSEDYRFQSVYDLLEGNLLANPAQADENGAYVYDANATAMIKNELVSGRAVTFGFLADQAQPGQELSPDSLLSFRDENGQKTDMNSAAIWAQYTYDKTYDPSDPGSVNHKVFNINHAACIVGYDDNFPKEYFNDPKGTLAGDGAWLVKNSWGSINAEDPAQRKHWGNGGDGYFWLSYYDQGISIPESFRFAQSKNSDTVLQNIDMYDFMPEINRDRVMFGGDVYMANVFTAKNNCTVRFIGIETVEADTTVEYSIYFLDEDAKSPTDGHCVLTEEVNFPYAGYHKIDLGRTLGQAKGNKYSIVAKAAKNGKSTVYFNHAETLDGFVNYYPSRQARYVDSGKPASSFNPDKLYSKGVVNKGESFISAGGTEWADWADVTSELKSMNAEENMDFFTYDNFPIRSYPETEMFTATNVVTDPQETYRAGDTVKGLLVIGNNTDEDFDDETEFELNVTIGADNTGISRTAAGLKAGENRTFDYTYTVTAADAKAGKVESTLKIKCNGEEVEYNPVFGDILSFTVTTVDSYIIGDANGDGVVDINDATAIQKAVAEIPLDFFDEKAADVDFNGLSVEDATHIQKYLVEYNTPYRIGETAEAGKSRTGFSDVAVGAWYEDAVDWGVDNGIAQGISDDLFGVGQALTVADMDKMLRRTAGLPDSEETSTQTVDRLTAVTAIWNQFANGETAECPFTDVTENAGAVGWAYKKGIIGGEPGSAFSPDKTEMREEFITMLYRWRWQSDGYIDRTVGVFREKLTDETAKVRYFSDARSIAYMSIADYYSIMLPGYTMKVTAEGGGKYKLTNACGSAVADVEKDTFHSDNYSDFTNLMWQIQDGMDNIYLDGYPFIQVVGADCSGAPKPVDFLFGEKYSIDLRADGDQVYFPVSTLSDMFANMDYLYSSYNGVNLYVNADNDMAYMSERDTSYFDPILCSNTRDAELAEFNYKELCFVFDNLYGYPGCGILYEDVALEQVGLDKALEDFGPVGTRTKQLLLSTDWGDYFMGMIRLSSLLDDGGHTSLFLTSISDVNSNPARAWISAKMSGMDAYEKYFSDMGEVMARVPSTLDNLMCLMDLRKEMLGDGHYFTQGDTAFYSMNGFVADKAPWKEYYANGGSFDDFDEPVFMGLISSLNKAQNDPDIHNFVIDLSTNGGGSADVLVGLLSLITGDRKGVLNYQNVLLEQEITQHFLVDRNFDGKFDEADADVHYDLNFAVLFSQESYSCGNLLPAMMKDRGYMLLGEHSRGGACTILGLNTADGFYYHISDYQMRLTNAAGEVIDSGIEPDVKLVKTGADGKKDYSDFYNLTLLSQLMNEFYANRTPADN